MLLCKYTDIFYLQQGTKQCSLVFLKWMQLRCTVRADPAVSGLFLLDSQFVFGDEVRTEANFEVENKTYALIVAKDSPFDMAITIPFLRSK